MDTDVRAVRRRLNLSQAAFAALIGVSQATVSRWESGAAALTQRDQLAIAEAERRAGALGPNGEAAA